MRRLKTHFEQIPVEIVKKIIEAEVAEKTAGSSAESEEGRLRIEENTLPLDTYLTQSGTAVAASNDCPYRDRQLTVLRRARLAEGPN